MNLYKIQKVRVLPKLPEKLAFLKELAYNLYWSWDHNSRSLFRRLDPDLWEAVNRNPVLMLGQIDQKRLEDMAGNQGYLAQLERIRLSVENYMKRKAWFEEQFGETPSIHIAYFSMEFGLSSAMPVYSGGLGVLAGDHLKSASDLGLPFYGIGLAYQQGYFQQYLASDGWQQETYPINDFYNLPFNLEKDDKGNPLLIYVDLPGRKVFAQIWRVNIGRIPLFLLDANIQQNREEDRQITAQLYGGDIEMRIKQEILLGIGGMRALALMNIKPEVCHMNEGHSAFLAIERIKMYMEAHSGVDFVQAWEATRVGNVFTTHTPVPAGIDQFEPYLIEQYLGSYCSLLNLPIQDFIRLGGQHYAQAEGKFNMAIFAINMAGAYNGVSRLHGRVARQMWNYLWPNVPPDEVPIGHVTNGIHIRSWLSSELSELYVRYLDPNWYRNPIEESMWERIDQIPDVELWRTHERRRERLVTTARKNLQERLIKLGAHPNDIDRAAEVLRHDALTIGFARRFATYKRAYLLFSDKERLREIVNNEQCPVQIIISGKAHPRDREGKEVLKNIMNIIKEDDFRDKIVFLENYDMLLAGALVQGVDVWLNTPRRPREASGTSGMKAAVNGALNLSILDGWWDEGYEMNANIGWAIGRGEEKFANDEEQDAIEAEELYHLLEDHVIPLFYKRGPSSIPREWIKMMKTSMKEVCPFFNTNRMIRDYLDQYYVPAAERWTKLGNDNGRTAKELANWRQAIRDHWNDVDILTIDSNAHQDVEIGATIRVSAQVRLGALQTDYIQVEVYYGRVDETGMLKNTKTVVMKPDKKQADGVITFKADVPVELTGQQGFSVRILPHHPQLYNPTDIGTMKWFNK